MHRDLRVQKQSLREAASRFDLTTNEALLLLCCSHLNQDGLAQKQLVAYSGVSSAQVSTTIESLQSHGLVESFRPAVDRRIQMWRTLSSGTKLASQLASVLADLSNRQNDDDRSGGPYLEKAA